MLDILNIDKLESVEHKVTTLETQVNNTIKTDGDGTKFLTDDGSYKPVEVDLSDYVSNSKLNNTLEEAIEPLATKEEVNTALEDKADKIDIITKTNGSGVQFLADDGTYKEITTTGVTTEQLNTAIEPLLTKEDAADIYLTQSQGIELYSEKASAAVVDTILASGATKQEVNEALALKADKTEIITKSDGDGTKYLADDGTYKTIQGGGTDDVTTEQLEAAVSALATKQELSDGLAAKADSDQVAEDIAEAVATKAETSDLENYYKKSDITLVTNGDGTSYLANDGSYKTITTQGPVDLTPYATTEAMNAALDLKADKNQIPDISGLATKAELEALDIPDVSDLATKQEVTEGLAKKANTEDIPDTSEFITTAALAPYAKEENVDAALELKANKNELPDITGLATKIELQEGLETKANVTDLTDINDVITTIQGNVNNKADKTELPDVSSFITATALEPYATTESVNTALSGKLDTTEAESTYAKKTDIPDISNLASKDEIPDISDLATKEEFTTGLATKANVDDIPDTSDMLTKTEANTTFATKDELETLDIPDITGLETSEHAETTYAKKSELEAKADIAAVGAALLHKANVEDIPDVSGFETAEHAEATYATQAALTEGLAGKVDTTELANYETTTHASTTYAIKVDVGTVANLETTAKDNLVNAINELKADIANIDSMSILVVTELPTEDIRTDAIYLLGSQDTETSNLYNEYIYIENTWEKIGSATIDLSDYITTSALNTALALKADVTTVTELATTVADHTDRLVAAETQLSGIPADIADALTKTEAANTYLTKDEFNTTGATKQWVQEYIASLDGTNVGF